MISSVMIFCTMLIIGALGGKEVLMKTLGFLFLSALALAVVLAYASKP